MLLICLASDRLDTRLLDRGFEFEEGMTVLVERIVRTGLDLSANRQVCDILAAGKHDIDVGAILDQNQSRVA